MPDTLSPETSDVAPPSAIGYAAYCTAHVGKSLLWAASDLLTLYVLVTFYGMTPFVAGAIFLAALIANALADLGVGTWLDRRPHHGPALATAALLVSAASFPATMLLAPYGAGAVLAAMLVFRIAYSGYDVPHNALMTQLAPTLAGSAWLSRGRTVGTGLAGFAIALGARGVLDRQSVPLVLWLIAGVACVIGMALIPVLRKHAIEQRPLVASHRFGLPLAFLAASVLAVVALGTLAKAVLHVRTGLAPIATGDTLLLLTAGRMASALLPLRIVNARRGLLLLVLAYLLAGVIAALIAWHAGTLALLLLGLAVGGTNLIGWALLPSFASGARGYGIYTMASKLGLGMTGLVLAVGLGAAPVFAPGAFSPFAMMVATACVAAAIVLTGLTSRSGRALSSV